MIALRTAVVSLLAAGLLASGCGDDDEDETTAGGAAAAVAGNFAGEVEGTNAYIGLVTNGEELLGYVCDGNEVSTWLAGPISDGQAELTNRDGETVGEVTFSAQEATGEVSVEGTSGAFTAELGTGEGGLYREAKGTPGEPGFTETGWVVLNDGQTKGLKNAILGDGSVRVSAASTQPTGYIEQDNL